MSLHNFTQLARDNWCAGDQPKYVYSALALAGEAGEIANEVKKYMRDDERMTLVRRYTILEEVGDLLYYTAILLDDLGATWGEVHDLLEDKISRKRAAGELVDQRSK